MQGVAPCPVVQVAAAVARALVAQRKGEARRRKRLAGRQLVGRGIRVDARHDAQHARVVHLERQAEVARPFHGAHEHRAAAFLHGRAQSHLEKGRGQHGRAAAQLRVDRFLAPQQALRRGLRLARPVARKLRQIVAPAAQVEQARGIARERHGARLAVADVGPRLYDVLFFIGHVVEHHVQRVGLVAQHNVGLRAPVGGRRRRRHVAQAARGVAVAVGHAQRGFEKVAAVLGGVGLVAPRRQGRQCVQVGGMAQLRAKVGLAEAPLVVGLQHQVGVVRRDAQRRLPVDSGRGGCQHNQYDW